MRNCFVLGTLLLLTGCATVSLNQADSSARNELDILPANWKQPSQTSEVQRGWIDKVGDKTLSKLVRRAQERNQDLRIAYANVRRSRALLVQAGADRFPEVIASADIDATGNSQDGGTSSRSTFTGFSASWELDIWGRIRAGRAASFASLLSAEEDFKFSQLSIAAQVAKAYFATIETARQIKVTKDTVAALQKTDQIVRDRLKNGEASAEDTALSRSDLESTRASLATAKVDKRTAIRALKILLNEYPSTDLKVSAYFPKVPSLPAAGIPAQLLQRRPDILAASRNVASASNFVVEAQAARLPVISITGSLGGSPAAGPGGVINSLSLEQLIWSTLGEVVLPIFNAKARKAEVEVQRADLETALANYVQTALSAFEEVENSLDATVGFARQVSALTEATKASKKAFSIALIRYQEGEVDLVDVLDIRQRVLSNESELISAQGALLNAWIDLNLALGESWTATKDIGVTYDKKSESLKVSSLFDKVK